MNDDDLRSKMSTAAQSRAADFGGDVFAERINSLF
jgi:hypothetical protein